MGLGCVCVRLWGLEEELCLGGRAIALLCVCSGGQGGLWGCSVCVCLYICVFVYVYMCVWREGLWGQSVRACMCVCVATDPGGVSRGEGWG